MKILKWFSVILAAVVLLSILPLAACNSESSEEEEKILSMYVAYGNPELVAQEFEIDTGIKVELITMSSGEVITRLRAEAANPQTDIWFGGGSDAFIQAKDEGIIQTYNSSNAGRVDAAFKDADGYWTGVSLVVVGLLVNKDRLNAEGLEIPDTWADLADPQYKGELMASNPNKSGTAYTTVSGILQSLGEEKGWAFLDEMYENIPYLEQSGSAPATKAIQGEFAIGIVPDPHNSIISNPNANLAAVFPSDGVLAWPSPVAIVTGAKHPGNARKFVDWCLSERGQQVLMEASPRVPTTDVKPLEGVPSLSDLNLIPYDVLKWGNERSRILDEFNTRYPQYQ
jgi:iron(III) transport system substrate-binding protein